MNLSESKPMLFVAAGVVTEVGSDVKQFVVGDRVCCGLQTSCGGAAEEAIVYEV